MATIPPDLFLTLFDRHALLHKKNHYTWILSLQALSRLAVSSGDPFLLERARNELLLFVEGCIPRFGNFATYQCGGNGAAHLFRAGRFDEAKESLEARAAEQYAAPRGEAGIYCRPSPAELPARKIWIDTSFAVCPFMADCGVAFGREDYVDDAISQILGMREIFFDAECGLVHQGKNFNGPGIVSADHWSRGNGWGLLALAEVLDALPPDHPRRAECSAALDEWLSAAAAFQNPEGLWYQEMTVRKTEITYTETSGSALILYAMATAIRHGISQSLLPAFEKGLDGLLSYVTPEGAVFNTCASCCCPEDGSIGAYLKRPPIKDDYHSFGAILMALAGALELSAFAKETQTSPHNS